MSLHASERIPAPSSADILARCCTLVQPALQAAVDRLHPWLRRMAGFSFGWCDLEGTPKAGPGMSGEGVRQALAVLSAEAAGGPAEAAIPGAVAVELVPGRCLARQESQQNLTCALQIADAPITDSAATELAIVARFLDGRSR